jgi:Ca2+-transporting ATPase
MLGAVAALLVLLLAVPGVRDAFHFGAADPVELLGAFAAGAVGVAWFEVWKVLRSR